MGLKNYVDINAFRAKSTTKVQDILASYGIETVRVPKNLTHLLQPLDLTANVNLKKIWKERFTEYFCSSILKEMKNDSTCDVTTIKIGSCLSTLTPCHAEVMKNTYNYFAFSRGKEIIKNGWKSSGMSDAIHETHTQANIINLNSFI